MRKERKHFYRYNKIDKFDRSEGFAPTQNLTIVQVGSYLWMLGGGYSGNDCVYSPGKKLDMNQIIHWNKLFSSESGYCYGSIDYCGARNPDVLNYYPVKCDCVLEEDTELWSMEKSRFVPSSLQLPFGIF